MGRLELYDPILNVQCQSAWYASLRSIVRLLKVTVLQGGYIAIHGAQINRVNQQFANISLSEYICVHSIPLFCFTVVWLVVIQMCRVMSRWFFGMARSLEMHTLFEDSTCFVSWNPGPMNYYWVKHLSPKHPLDAQRKTLPRCGQPRSTDHSNIPTEGPWVNWYYYASKCLSMVGGGPFRLRVGYLLWTSIKILADCRHLK